MSIIKSYPFPSNIYTSFSPYYHNPVIQHDFNFTSDELKIATNYLRTFDPLPIDNALKIKLASYGTCFYAPILVELPDKSNVCAHAVNHNLYDLFVQLVNSDIKYDHQSLLNKAINNNCINIVKFLHEKKEILSYNKPLKWIIKSIRCHNYDMAMWLHREMKTPADDDGYQSLRIMDLLASHGALDAMRWFNDNTDECCTSDAVYNSINNGYLDVLKWLWHEQHYVCGDDILQYAIGNNQLHIVQWMADRIEYNAVSMVHLAIQNAHVEIVKWIIGHSKKVLYFKYIVDYAALSGDLDTVKWAHKNYSHACTKYAMNNACMTAALDVMTWLYTNTKSHNMIEALTYVDTNNPVLYQWCIDMVFSENASKYRSIHDSSE